jgi:ABC-type uncharacterized transport system permease subunit
MAVSRVELLLLAVFCALAVIVLINMLIAIVSSTFKAVKKKEDAYMLRNYATIIDEIERSLADSWRQYFNYKNQLGFVHVLEPQAVSWLAEDVRIRDRAGSGNAAWQVLASNQLKGVEAELAAMRQEMAELKDVLQVQQKLLQRLAGSGAR